MDAAEFKQRFLPLSRRLYIVAWRITGNEQDSEDIVQDAYLKLWKKRDDLVNVENLEAYSVTLVKRLCYDFLHDSHGNYETEIADDLSPGCSENAVENKETLSIVEKIINGLPEQQKMIVTMREVNDCSFEEIEKATGLNAVNVRVILSRARKKIREQFNELQNHENRRN